MKLSQKPTSPGLRPARVLATAFAALTGAFLASELGVYGTVIGAGVFSFMTTVGTEFYLRSLDRTKLAAKQAREAALARTGRAAALNGVDGLDASPTAAMAPPTTVLPTPDQQPTQYLRRPTVSAPPTLAPAPTGRKGIRWSIVGGVTVLAFGLGMLTITGIEAITGNSISGGEGTTAGRVITGNKNADRPPATPEAEPSETTTPPATTEETTAPSETESAPASEIEESLKPSETEEPSESADPSDEPSSTRPPLFGG